MVTIACVLRSGGSYSPDWVSRLRHQVRQQAPFHRFVCLTDQPVWGAESVLLRHGWLGWWSKIELFRPGIFAGRVLFLDLDVLVTGDLAPLIDGTGFKICRDWWTGGLNSSVMAWDAGDTEIYDRFVPAEMARLHGDQDWIEQVRPRAATFDPGLVVSFKAHCSGGMPAGARVVAFHGRPKPDEVSDEWVRARWVSAGEGIPLAEQ